MVKSEPKKKPQPGGFFQKFFRKPEKSQKEQRLTVQRSIPYLEMGRDGICRVEEHLYSKTIRFYDINYQLAQNEDKNTIFESWCDFLNYFDASIRFQLSFINHKSDMSEYNKVIQIEPQHDAFDDVRMEYAQMLKQQLAKAITVWFARSTLRSASKQRVSGKQSPGWSVSKPIFSIISRCWA